MKLEVTKMLYFSILRLSILTIFVWLNVYGREENESPPYVQYVTEVTRAFSKQIKKEFDLECIGNGSSMPHDVEEISIKFVAYQRATVEQARELEVKITERLIRMINAHEKIKPFLRESPFPFYRTRVGISFYKKNNSPYVDGSVAYVSLVNSRIYYSAEDPSNPYVYKEIKDEPYEEARRIVQGTNS